MLIANTRDLREALKEGRFTSVGCYPIFFLTHDGEHLDPQTVRDNLKSVVRAVRSQDKSSTRLVVACDVNWEDNHMVDAHTGDAIECAYPPDESES